MLTVNGREPRAQADPSSPAFPLYLDPTEAEQQKRLRARRLHVVGVPATRLVGFAMLLVLAYLHNRFVLSSFSWRAYLQLATVLISWALLGWLLLYALYERLGTRLAFALLMGDIAMFALVVYATGGTKSWLFFILVVRSTDVAFLSARQLMVFAHASALAYVALLGWLAAVEGQSLDWPAEMAKSIALWGVCLYLALTRRIVEVLRARTAAAVRAARDLARRLEEAWRRAEMLSAAKSRFLASMSHELRTPLHAIVGSARLVQDTSLTTAQQRYFTAIGVSTQNLLYTVSQILDFFRAEAGKVELECVAFRLRQELEPVVQSLGIRAEERGLELACHVDNDVPDVLLGDVGRLRQVLINLVDNGLKFTERGGVTLRVSMVACRPDGVSLSFAVVDTGIGIRSDHQSLIFEAFAQASTSADRRRDGVGLGLAIASELVRRLGGELRVDSEVGQGSAFHFVIDFALGEPDEASDSSALISAALAADVHAAPAVRDNRHREARDASRRLYVLVVDDDRLSLEVARDALERRGHTVVVARTGREAIETCDRIGFDAVLLDAQLPEIDGFATASALRERERRGGARTRIVVLSAAATPGARERGLTAGVDVYLTKPLEPRMLVAAIEAQPLDTDLPRFTDLGLNPGARTRIARLFLTEAPRQMDDVRLAMTRRDHAALFRAAHRLKGAVGNFGASAALDAVARLEVMTEGDHPACSEAFWASLEEQLQSLTVALAALLERIGGTDDMTIGVDY